MEIHVFKEKLHTLLINVSKITMLLIFIFSLVISFQNYSIIPISLNLRIYRSGTFTSNPGQIKKKIGLINFIGTRKDTGLGLNFSQRTILLEKNQQMNGLYSQQKYQIKNRYVKNIFSDLYNPVMFNNTNTHDFTLRNQVAVNTAQLFPIDNLSIASINTPTPTQSPTSNTTSNTIDEFGISLLDSFSKTLGTLSATLVFLIILSVIVSLIVLIIRTIVGNKPEFTIQAFQTIDNEKKDDTNLLSIIYQSFMEPRRDIEFIRGRLDFPHEPLKYFIDIASEFVDIPSLTLVAGPDPSDIELKVSLGPLEVSNFIKFWKRIIHKRRFLLTVDYQNVLSNNNQITLAFILIQNAKIWYSKRVIDISKNNIQMVITEIIREISWAMSCKNIEKVQQIYWIKPPELLFLKGINLIAEYIYQPKSIKPLEKARISLHEAANLKPDWAFEAGLLEAIALQLTQSQPGKTVDLLSQLLTKYSGDKQKEVILKYNLGQAKFYQYTESSYDEGIELLCSIKRPYDHLWNDKFDHWLNSIKHDRLAKQQYCLFLLAMSNVAIIKAHKINLRNKSKEENKDLVLDILSIIEKITGELDKVKSILDIYSIEIEWRLLNAEVMIDLNTQSNVIEGIEKANNAIRLAPYALDVKANLGSLNLLHAAQLAVKGQNSSASDALEKSNNIFEGLFDTGWDPGFVLYRLGTIRRVQGKFKNAREFLNQASNPAIRDVPQNYINIQIDKVDKYNKLLILEDV